MSDMAADGTGLFDALGIDCALIVGGSMGGMIAQTIAAVAAPRRTHSVSIYSTSDRPGLPLGFRGTGDADGAARRTRARAAHRPRQRTVRQTIGSPGYPTASTLRALSRPQPSTGAGILRGAARRYLAIIASGDRVRAPEDREGADPGAAPARRTRCCRSNAAVTWRISCPGRVPVLSGMGS